MRTALLNSSRELCRVTELYLAAVCQAHETRLERKAGGEQPPAFFSCWTAAGAAVAGREPNRQLNAEPIGGINNG